MNKPAPQQHVWEQEIRDDSFIRATVANVYRRIPPARGKERPLRALNEAFLRRSASPMVVAPMRMGYMMIVDLRTCTEFRSYYTGDYDTTRIRSLTRLIEPGSTIIDIGANIGFWTVPLAMQAARQGGRVLAFEPVPANVERLEANLRLNGMERIVEVRALALSSSGGAGVISLREDFQRGSTGNAAMVIPDGEDDRFCTIQVPLARLDDEIDPANVPPISFVKMDVEGHEDLVLEGATITLTHHRPVIAAEFNEDYFRRRSVDIDERVSALCHQHSWDVFTGNRRGMWRKLDSVKGRAVTDDVLLVPREKSAQTLQRLAS